MSAQQAETQPESGFPDVERTQGFTYKAFPENAAVVRREVGAVLREWGFGEVEFDLRLCVDEAFTNALCHGDGPEITITVTSHGPAVRIEVEDHAGPDSTLVLEVPWEAAIAVTAPELDKVAERGRGLFLIAGLSTCWGILPRDCGAKTVWFELDTSATATAS